MVEGDGDCEEVERDGRRGIVDVVKEEIGVEERCSYEEDRRKEVGKLCGG